MMQTFKYNKQSLLSNWFPVQYFRVIWLLTTWCWLTLSSQTIINMTCLGSIDRCPNLVDKKETANWKMPPATGWDGSQFVFFWYIRRLPSPLVNMCASHPVSVNLLNFTISINNLNIKRKNRVKFYDILWKLQRHNDEICVLPPECEFPLESMSCYCCIKTFFTLHILRLHVINVMTEKAFVCLCYY